MTRTALVPLSLLLAGCVSTQGITATCDIHYVGPVPAQYATPIPGQDIRVVTKTAAEIQTICKTSPVGCFKGLEVDPNADKIVLYYPIYVVDDPSPWGVTRDYVIAHESGHARGWPECHPH